MSDHPVWWEPPVADHNAPEPPPSVYEAISEIRGNALYVNVEWLDLLAHHMGDERAAFEQLGKLKDFLRD